MLGLLIWLVCGFVSAGFLCAFFTRRYIGQSLSLWRNTNIPMTLFTVLSGPIGLFAAVLFLISEAEGKYWGFRVPFTKITKEEWEKWATAYQKRLYSREWSIYSRSLDEGDEK